MTNTDNRIKSKQLFQNAQRFLPGGVNSPVRSFKEIDCEPIFFKHAQGASFTDEDDNEYTDYCLSWGVHILGHNHPHTITAIKESIDNGISYGACCKKEAKLAELICDCYSSIDKIRFVNSGTEATMSAIRLARGYTQRDIIIKFDGCYHGHSDSLLVSAGSGVSQISTASSAGVPQEIINNTISIPFNDPEAVKEVFSKFGSNIAAVIIEPIPANMGVIPADKGYLQYIREITENNQTLLIFDEVISGFRVAPAGAQQLYNITPDLTCLGKIIGGGFPVGAFGGKNEIMELLAPNGPVYQAGTLSGNPIAMTAGYAILSNLINAENQKSITDNCEYFISKLTEILPKKISLHAIGPMFTIFFTPQKPTCFDDVKKCDFDRFTQFYKYLLNKGIYLSPSQYETNFISTAHTKEIMDQTLDVISDFFK